MDNHPRFSNQHRKKMTDTPAVVFFLKKRMNLMSTRTIANEHV